MAFTLDRYAALRPFLYHVTARENLHRLRRTHRIETARAILQAADHQDLLRARRPNPETMVLQGEPIILKDQRPLLSSNVALKGPWQFADFVEYLNNHVYFWPGDALGMLAAGRRLLSHYGPDHPLVLRVPFRALADANPDVPPVFSPYNSGAPRMHRGKPVKRGPHLFRPAEGVRGRPHEVIEVAFRGAVALPPETAVAGEPESWVRLAAAT